MKTPGWSYSRIALGAVSASVCANILQALTGTQLWILFLVNIGCLIVLSGAAVSYHDNNRPGFDPVVAAETIVAFGVTSLILSLVSAAYPLFVGRAIGDLFKTGGLGKIATPFLEGLATAGLAPLFAMILRNRVAEAEGTGDAVGDLTGLARAMAGLTREMDAARASMTELQVSLKSASVSTKALADNVQTEAERLKLVLLEAQAELKGLSGAASSSRTEVGELASETAKLKSSMTENGVLLAALAKLIESVERFVAPGGRRRS